MNENPLNRSTAYPLLNGETIPALGLGVYQMPESRHTEDAVAYAISCGYRHIDTAMIYQNEASVGKAVKRSLFPREKLFITTKLWNSDHGYDRAIKAFRDSLKLLDMDYVDLYLIHWPAPGKRAETWRALETLYEEGLAKSIGVSNYMENHMEELLAVCKHKPVTNQIEMHPFIYKSRKGILELCEKESIITVAYSPLTKATRLNDPFLVKMAASYKKTPAQLLIRWGLQHGFSVIPKSEVRSRIEANFQVFDFTISEADMARLDSVNEGPATGWDPAEIS